MRDLVTGRSSWGRLGRFGAIAALAVSVGCLAGCLPPDTVVLVQVESTLPLDGVHRLHVTLKVGGKTRVLDIPQQPVPITLPTSFTVQLGRSLGGRLDITVEARDAAGAALASAAKSISDLTQGQQNTVTIDLTGGGGGTDGGTDGAPADGSVDVSAVDAGVDMVVGSGGAGGVPAGRGGAGGSGGSAGGTGTGGRAGSSSGGGGGAGRVGSGGVMGSGGAVGAGGAAEGMGGADGGNNGGGLAGYGGASAGASGAGGSSSAGGASGGGLGGSGDEGAGGP